MYSKKEIDRLVGAGIKKEREARLLSRDDLAQMLGLTSSHLGLLERGERGTTARNLYALSYYLQAPVDIFFNNKKARKSAGPASNKAAIDESNRRRINTLIKLIEGDGLAHVMYVVDSIYHMSRKES